MSGFIAGRFATGLAVTGAVVLGAFLVTWIAGRALHRWNVVDVTWGASFALVAVASWLWSDGIGASPVRRDLALVLTVVWAARLAGYIAVRSRGKGEDPRYAEILDRAAGNNRSLAALRVVILPQAVLSWLVSLPVQVAMYERGRVGPLTWVAVGVWATGLFFESVGDYQMSAFRRDPSKRGKVMDQGLWRYTRHPNYFGDACVWFGLYLLAAGRWPGVTTILSPLVMLYFLYYRSGKGLLEKRMADSRPGYREYMRRTSGFLPLPPRAP